MSITYHREPMSPEEKALHDSHKSLVLSLYEYQHRTKAGGVCTCSICKLVRAFDLITVRAEDSFGGGTPEQFMAMVEKAPEDEIRRGEAESRPAMLKFLIERPTKLP